MIVARDLSKTFDAGKTYALDHVNVRINPGEFVAIIGLSGAGKSTFLRTINGTCRPSFGHIEVLGTNAGRAEGRTLSELRRRIGFIFQQFNLVKSLTVLQNVLVGRVAYNPLWRTLTGLYPKEDLEIAKSALRSVGMDGRLTEKVRNLSGGQQQRVAIARALVQNPEIILADEPMASLDPKLSEVVLGILQKINRERQITVLVNIHVLEYARKYAHRVLAFRQGQLVFDGSPSQLTPDRIEMIYRVETSTEDEAVAKTSALYPSELSPQPGSEALAAFAPLTQSNSKPTLTAAAPNGGSP